MKNLRAYKHTDGNTYFVNGFSKSYKTGNSLIIFTNLYTGELFTDTKENFEKNTTIINKKK